jgi:hypothetical protein
MQIQVWFSNNKYVDIQLFDNDTVAKWFLHFQKLSLNNFYTAYPVSEFINYHPLDKPTADNCWNGILNTLDKLSNMGYKIPFHIADVFDYKQSTLNFLHRFFTYNAAWYWNNKTDPTVSNSFDTNFKLAEELSYSEWLGLINDINSAVHRLEHSTDLGDNKKFILNELPVTAIHVNSSSRIPTDATPWLSFTEQEQQLNYTYFDSELPLVVLDQSILGKCVLQSFAEDDDLNAEDCTGRVGSYGGFFVDLTSNRKKIYQSEQFKNWVSNHNRDFASLPLEFSIGYVGNYQDVLQWINQHLKFKKIMFVD